MPTLSETVIYANTTANQGFRYQFTPKHHGRDPQAAQWIPELTLDEEFGVFDLADVHELEDDRGWLYGVLPREGELRDLGTWNQQLAEFPLSREGQPWHGYPIWSVNEWAPANRRGERMRPDKQVLMRMQAVGLLTARQRKRLQKGDHA